MTIREISQTLLLTALAVGCNAYAVPTPQAAINSDKDLKLAINTAKTPDDHERIAAYCKSKADQLDAQAAQYEEAAATDRGGPVVKNIEAPNSAARYDATARDLRDQAKSKRALEATQEQLVREAAHSN